MNPMLAVLVFIGGPAALLVGWMILRDRRRSRELGPDADGMPTIGQTRFDARGDVDNWGVTIGMRNQRRPRP